jgi:molybdate transport system substrate-binding protein
MNRRALLLASLAAALPTAATRAADAGLTVFAASSLTDALQDIGHAWTAQGGAKPVFNFAASSTLARQIEQGAVANLFASADLQWMDWLDQRHLIVDGTRRTLLGNTLVLVMPKATVRPVTIGPGFDLAGLLGPNGRLATGDPASVPVGLYAKQALTKLGLWPAIGPHIAGAENVRSALLLVERGEAPAGIVYATDAAVSPGVAIAGTFPADSHEPILYPFAIPRGGDTPAARAFLDFLGGPAATGIFVGRGFAPQPA